MGAFTIFGIGIEPLLLLIIGMYDSDTDSDAYGDTDSDTDADVDTDSDSTNSRLCTVGCSFDTNPFFAAENRNAAIPLARCMICVQAKALTTDTGGTKTVFSIEPDFLPANLRRNAFIC